MSLSLTIDDREVTQRLREFGEKGAEASERAAVKAAIWLMNRAVNDAPVDTGLLRSSASIFKNGGRFMVAPNISTDERPRHPSSADTPGANQSLITVGFNTHYAAEMDSRRDVIHPRGGKAGYLTDNFRLVKSIYEGFLKQEFEALT